MKTTRRIIALLLLTTTLPAAADSLQVSDEERELLGIEVSLLELTNAGSSGEITLRAEFAPDGQWAVKTPFPGILHRAWVQVGDRVSAGAPLVSVRSPEVVELQRGFLRARAELDLQEAAIDRDRRLNEAGSVSERRWKETQYAYRNAKAEFAGLRAQLQLAGYGEQDLHKLIADMDISPEITLRAPVDALVLERPAPLGEHLEGNELLAKLGEPGKLMLTGMLSSTAADTLAPGNRLRGPDGAEAVLTFVSSVIDPETQTVRVRAEPVDPDALQPGRLGSWRVLTGADTLILPSGAVVKLDGKDTVYVQQRGGFEVRPVSVRSAGAAGWIVLDGLVVGERVAVSGTVALKGMSVGMGGGEG